MVVLIEIAINARVAAREAMKKVEGITKEKTAELNKKDEELEAVWTRIATLEASNCRILKELKSANFHFTERSFHGRMSYFRRQIGGRSYDAVTSNLSCSRCSQALPVSDFEGGYGRPYVAADGFTYERDGSTAAMMRHL